MCCEKSEEDIYKATIDNSKEMSLQKAIAIFMEEQEKNKTTVTRPNINPQNGIMKILLVVTIIILLCFLFRSFNVSLVYVLILALCIAVISAKKTVIWLILLYQKYAPERIRKSCVFEPTCSNYMLQAIEKYGLFKGIIKGIKRLLRCHQPNGGVDNP